MSVEREPLSHEAIEVYLGAVDWLIGVLNRDEVTAAWAEPSCVPFYSVGGVAAHAVHSVMWLEQLLRDTEPVGLRKVTLGEFFGPNRVDVPQDDDVVSAALRSAAEAFALVGMSMVVTGCRDSRDAVEGLLGAMPADRAVPVIRVAGGQAPLRDYLKSRVLEVVVHGDDVASSVPGLRVPDPPDACLTVCLDVCVELARSRVGGLGALRAFTRGERSQPDTLRVL